MNKLLVGIISSVLLISLVVPVQAQFGWLPQAGITPDSPFYFLDQWGEGIGMTFAFSNQAKVNKALKYSEEKLAEMKEMTENNKQTEKASENYQHYLELAQRKSDQVQQRKKEKVTERVASSTSKHLSVLEDVLSKVPEQAQAAITKAKNESKQGHLKALEALSQSNPQRAVKIGSNSLQQRLQQTKQAAERKQQRQFNSVLRDFQDIQGKVNQLQGNQVELLTLGSKGKVDQMEILSEIDQASDQMSEKERSKVAQVKRELQNNFEQSLSSVAQKSPGQAAKINLEAIKSKVQWIEEKGERVEEKTQRCESECEQICRSEEIEPCVNKCVEAAECSPGDQQCLDEVRRRCEGACQSRTVLGECVSDCSQACTRQMEQELQQETEELQNQHQFGEEISNIAQQIGKDQTKVQQLVATATTRHLKVLNEVLNKVPEQAQPGIESAIRVSKQGRERAMETLRKKAEQGSTEASEALEKVREKAPEEIIPGAGEQPGAPEQEEKQFEEPEGSQGKPEQGGQPGPGSVPEVPEEETGEEGAPGTAPQEGMQP